MGRVVEMVARLVTTGDILDGHVGLDITCLDRIYLNGYVPGLQVGGQIVRFLRHRGFPIPSPAVVGRIGDRFRSSVRSYATMNAIPVVRFARGDRKVEVMHRFLDRQARTGRSGVAAIGVAQEFAWVADCTVGKARGGGAPHFDWHRAQRRVTVFYFYLWDARFGSGFIKICSYFPYPIKVWVNGHEWAKRQATTAGIGFTALSNGFATCADPTGLQEICDRLGPAQIEAFFEYWMLRLPTPLDGIDFEAGYWWELSMRQIEVSRTLVFTRPQDGRRFIEALIADNIDLGRPDQVEVLFGRKDRQAFTPASTRIATRDGQVTINASFKHSRLKQYFKDGRALRVETVINNPGDLGVKKRLEHLPELVAEARAINDRVIDHEHVGQGCVLESPAFARISGPTLNQDGQRAPALRFGDPRVQALAGALATTGFLVGGITRKEFLPVVAALLGQPYEGGRATYDLRRLRLNGLIQRLPRSNTYVLTPDGQRFALFYTKVHDRLLRPLMAADRPPASHQLRQALRLIDREVDDYCHHARITPKSEPAAA